jgi:hypothetical protein
MTENRDRLSTAFYSEENFFALDGLLNESGLLMNSALLKREFDILNQLFIARCQSQAVADPVPSLVEQARTMYESPGPDTPFGHLVNNLQLDFSERVLLLLALEPHYNPVSVNERLSALKQMYAGFPSAFAYYKDPFSQNHYPTLQTAFFLCGGNDPHEWRKMEQEILHRGRLFHEQIIVLRDPDHRGRMGNRLNQLIDLAPEYVDYVLHGRSPRPDFGRAFPASWVSTTLSWDQLVLNKLTMSEISDVMDWVEHSHDVLRVSQGKINKSFPCLFYGPPGTGKSFTAKLIGKQYKKNVFRIDLSMIVSKYIGETEKNLAQLFDRAEGKDWILFFDEADALFGKRTGISDSKDKWANLEMSYLLQRMEEHKGLCILATNLKQNLDPALTRRFQALIHFPFPKADERALIWEKSLPPGFQYPENISFEKLAYYELSGAGIANVIKAGAVKAAKRGDYILSTHDMSRFIKLEYAKDSRTASRVQQS